MKLVVLAPRALCVLAILLFSTFPVFAVDGCSTPDFRSPVFFDATLGGPPQRFAAADYDGDGKIDVAVTDSSPNAIGIMLNKGAGSFGPVKKYGLDATPNSIASADFNGDTRLDLAVSTSSNNLFVMLGMPGGTFASPIAVSVGSSQGTVISGDFNNDTKSDLAVLGGDSNVALLLGNGNGSFTAATGSPFAVGGRVSSLASADFNSDTKLDLTIATQSGFFLLTGNGLGGFAAPQLIVNFWGVAVAAGDVNNDGKADIVMGLLSKLAVALGNGNGTFAAVAEFNTDKSSSVQSVVIAEMDGDNKRDIAVALSGPTSISYFKGDGAGSFTQTANYMSALEPVNIVVADFDNDSDQDVVSGYSLFFNSGSGVLDGARTFNTVLQMPPFAQIGLAIDIAVADLNVDGRSDLAVLTRPVGSSTYTVTPLLREIDGNFVATTPLAFFLSVGASTSIEVSDFNNDTFPDIALAGLQVSPFGSVVKVMMGNGDGTFGPPTTFNKPSTPFMTSGDVNNDGIQDLVLLGSGVEVMLGGVGGFNTVFGASVTGSSAAVANLDADNNLDLVITDRINKKVYTLLGNGGGSFGNQRTFDVANFPNSVVVGDFNGDSKNDVAVTLVPFDSVQLDGHIAILIGDGTGNMGSPVTYVAGGQPAGIISADFDNDGKLDLAVSDNAVLFSETLTPAISVLSGDGMGSFFPAVHFQLNGPGPLVASDFNTDGRIDIATSLFPTSAAAILYGKAPLSHPCLFADDATVPEASPTGNITVRLSAASSQVVSANYRFKVLGPGATDNVDFVQESGTVVFQPGETSKLIPTTIISDAIHENTEAYALILSMPQNARISDGVAKMEIVDDDPAPTLSIGDLTVTEANGSTTATLTVTLSGPSQEPIFVQYATAPGTAQANLDYSHTQGTLSYGSGVTSQTISVEIVSDQTNEPEETFFVNLTNPTRATILDSQAQVTIHDNDPVPTVSIQDGSASEIVGGNSTINANITLSNPISVPVTVSYATADNTATAGSDYIATSGTVTFNPGETQKTVALTVLEDTIDEASPETFFVNLSSPTIVTIADSQGSYSIFDNDGPTISINDVTVVEGSGGFAAPTNLTFTVSLSAPTFETVLVRLTTSNGTAISGLDYQGVNRFLQIPIGSTSVTTNISIIGDMIIEPTETFFANLSMPSGATIADAQGIGTITDNDVTSVQFASTTASVNESDGTVTVAVQRVGDLTQPFTAFYLTQDFGGASSRSDYTTAIGLLEFAPGESAKDIKVFITNDVIVESPESFLINLVGSNGAQVNSPSSIEVTVVSDDVGSAPNPVDSSEFFVRQHYRDFLNRDPDPDGLAFWVNEIESCGSIAQCREVKRINVSAAFFLSIEFQETGYLAYRTWKAAFGDTTSTNVPGTVPIIMLTSFLLDGGRIGQGVQVGVGNWQQHLENNKSAYLQEFVQGPGFKSNSNYPDSMSAEQFVDRLDQRAGSVLSPTERSELIAILGATPADVIKRALVLRRIAEDTDLTQRELNRAFVLMQYYGYLRRNPDDFPDNNFGGWKFWLDKLNQANGNFIEAEMVKAFITSIEYRNRFAP